MIITCEKCSTRFQLDASRVPASGAKVRCSRCRHAFVVRPPEPPGASDAEAAQGLAREAAVRVARQRKPPASEDRTQALGPDSSGGRTQEMERPRAEGEGGGGDEESDWQFAEDLAAGEGEAEDRTRTPTPAPDPVRELFPDAAEPAPPAEALADVGSPEEWNLLGGEAAPSAPAPRARAPQRPAARAAVAQAPSALPEPARLEPAATPAARAAGLGAWLAVAALVLAAAYSALLPARPAPSAAQAGAVSLAGLELSHARGRIVENAIGGSLLVVAARIVNPGGEPRLPEGGLAVRLVSADGTPLGDAAPLGPGPEPDRLRGDAPETLAAEQQRAADELARTPLPPGEPLEVAAIFAAAPPEARGFRFEIQPRPALSAEASPPSLPPSSE